MTREERYELKIQKKAERKAKEERIASFNEDKALMLLLQGLCKEDKYDEVTAYLAKERRMGYSFAHQSSKSVYNFYFIGDILGIMACTFIIDIDTSRREAFYNSLQRRFSRFDMMEIKEFDDYTIAFD
jgi:hypothetical protein